MDPHRLPATTQKRKASISHVSSPAKRARAVSITVKVSHGPTPVAGVGDPEICLPLKNPRACLGGIPEELLLKTFEHLDEDKDALAKLCRVDECCKRIGTEVLYRSIDGSWKDGSVQLEMFRIITNNAEVAKHVKVMNVGDGTWSREAEARALFSKALRMAVNIQELDISDCLDMQTERANIAQAHVWIDVFNNAAYGLGDDVNPFAHLKQLTIASNGGLGIKDLESIFLLPSVESITLRNLVEPAEIEEWAVPASSCPLKDLQMRQCFIDSAVVAQILSSAQALESLEFQFVSKFWEPFSPEHNLKSQWAHNSWSQVRAALTKHKESLTGLYLGEHIDSDIIETVFPGGRETGTLGSLKEFDKLKQATLPISILLDLQAGETDLAAKLPSGIESLVLEFQAETDVYEQYGPALATLSHGTFTKKVKQLCILAKPSPVPISQMFLSKHMETLQKAGISTEVLGGLGWNLSSFKGWTLEELRKVEVSGIIDEELNDEEIDEEAEDDGDEMEDDSGSEISVDSAEHAAEGLFACRNFDLSDGTHVTADGEADLEITVTNPDGTMAVAGDPASFAAAVAEDPERWFELLNTVMQGV